MELNEVQEKVFFDRYALRDENGELIEHSVEDMWKRIAFTVADAEKANDKSFFYEAFYHLLENFKFVPGGRILKGAGAKSELTYYNCYVLPSPEDSRQGIMDTAKDLTEVMSRGGGVGVNLSSLRPRGAYVKGVNGTSSGPVSWAELYSQVAGSVIQGGSRRGALMLMLNVEHPDIEEFITVKQDLGKLNNANLSVGISDSFMQAVKENKEWQLHFDGEIYKTVNAADLWHLICKSAWQSGEPGIVFLEHCNKLSNTWYYEDIVACNPCGEEPLPPWGVCNLGHINLTQFIDKEYRAIKWDELRQAIDVAVRFLDNIIDITPYFFDKNKEAQERSRRIGLGTMGLADLLIIMNIKYGSEESVNFCNKLYKFIAQESYAESIRLAEEKGSFPAFDKYFLDSRFIKHLPEGVQLKIKSKGIRNATLLTQAPTGTTAVLANVSSGIEPNFAFEYKRKDRIGEYTVKHPLAEGYITGLPNYFVTAEELTPEEHVKMQATIQKWTDASISKTVNAPNHHTIKEVENLYTLAYDLGCKGITYFRDGSREGVLSKIDTEEITKHEPAPLKKKPVLTNAPARRIKIKTGCGDMWITMVFDDSGKLSEILTITGHSGGCPVNTEALSRMISCALRYGIPPAEVAKQLTETKPCRSFDRLKQKDPSVKAKSCPHAIALEIQNYLQNDSQEVNRINHTENKCPDCGSELNLAEGCVTCISCGYSKCN